MGESIDKQGVVLSVRSLETRRKMCHYFRIRWPIRAHRGRGAARSASERSEYTEAEGVLTTSRKDGFGRGDMMTWEQRE